MPGTRLLNRKHSYGRLARTIDAPHIYITLPLFHDFPKQKHHLMIIV